MLTVFPVQDLTADHVGQGYTKTHLRMRIRYPGIKEPLVASVLFVPTRPPLQEGSKIAGGTVLKVGLVRDTETFNPERAG